MLSYFKPSSIPPVLILRYIFEDKNTQDERRKKYFISHSAHPECSAKHSVVECIEGFILVFFRTTFLPQFPRRSIGILVHPNLHFIPLGDPAEEKQKRGVRRWGKRAEKYKNIQIKEKKSNSIFAPDLQQATA
jgi:hypothetical protein